MLISHKHKFIFTKTIKTGSTSVECYFERFCVPKNEWKLKHHRDEYESEFGIVGYRGKDNSNKKWYNHMAASKIKLNIGDDIWYEYYKFCVIRNPLEKVLSAFFHFFIHNNNISISTPDIIYLFRDWITRNHFIKPERQIYLIDNKICMDFIIKYEHLYNDLEFVCYKLNVPFYPETVPRFKSGFRPKGAKTCEFYDEKTALIVKKAYSFEFDNFYNDSLNI